LVHTHFLDVLFEIHQPQLLPELLGRQAQKYPPTPLRAQRGSLVSVSTAQPFVTDRGK
jgi:hypothetical protein